MKVNSSTLNEKIILIFTNQSSVYKLYNDKKQFQSITDILTAVELDTHDSPIYIFGTNAGFKGHMLFAYENGKMAKIPIESYKTKTKRKQIKSAYSSLQKLVYIKHIYEDLELVAYTDKDKVILFNTDEINPKTTPRSSGVQIMNMKDGSKLKGLKSPDKTEIADLEYYRKSIPAVGYYLKEGDIL